jgi:hypothetical protein
MGLRRTATEANPTSSPTGERLDLRWGYGVAHTRPAPSPSLTGSKLGGGVWWRGVYTACSKSQSDWEQVGGRTVPAAYDPHRTLCQGRTAGRLVTSSPTPSDLRSSR